MIGPFPPPPMGPAIKNEIIKKALSKTYKVNNCDTTGSMVLFFKSFFVGLIHCSIFYLGVSKKGQLLFLPIILIIKIFTGKTVLFSPAGGQAYENIKSIPQIIRKIYILAINTIDKTFVETQGMKNKLDSICKEEKVDVIPNPKPYKVKEIKLFSENTPLKERKIAFFSRIREKKGVQLLIEAVDNLRKDHNIDISLHFYGLVTSEYEDKFKTLIKNKEHIRFFGVLPHDKTIVETLNEYYMMVFPTMFDTEGFPGVLADAALAGLPVVASDIAYNAEIVKKNLSGLLFENNNLKDLEKKIYLLLNDVKMRNTFARNTLEDSKKYEIKNCIEPIIEAIKKETEK
jgi:glycosyltransferase involved in cell wall biosynthesis